MNRIRTLAITCVIAALGALAATALAHDPKHGTGHHGCGVEDGHGEKVRARSGTKVSIRVRRDRFSGWNLLIRTKRFRFAPEHASERHRRGEGHAHLEIDGKPITRIYGRGFYIPKLEPGRHRGRVALATNSHAEYIDRKGRPLADTDAVKVPKGDR